MIRGIKMSYDIDYKNVKAQHEYVYPPWLCALMVIAAMCVPSGIVFYFS
jgi:hypothetical protein